jgi:sugar lactone lactonase YvrE
VLDLRSGKVRRVLDKVPQTLGTPGIALKVDGQTLTLPSGYPFTINCDGIALGPENKRLFFEAPTNGNLYSIATADLRNSQLDDATLVKRVRLEANVGPTDGFATGPDGAIYVTSVEDHSVRRVDPSETPVVTVVANDPRLDWPDGMAWSPKGSLYVTASQIPRMPRFNDGQSTAHLPYQLFRCQPLVSQAQPGPIVPPTP